MSGIVEGAAKVLTGGPIKQSVGAVFDTVNRKVEAFDLLGKYVKAQKRQIKTTHANIKLLGMTSPIPHSTCTNFLSYSRINNNS